MPFEVIVTLDKMNRAKHLYDTTSCEEERNRADGIFADCYNLLIQQGVPIRYDKQIGLWLFAGRS